MTSKDSNGLDSDDRPSLIRRDQVVGDGRPVHEMQAAPIGRSEKIGAGWSRFEPTWRGALICAMVVFSAFPIVNLCSGLSTKDYGLWYQVGLAVRQGQDIYPRPETGRLFPFMYPPSAAAMLAWVSLLGSIGSLLALVLVNSVAWATCIWLSVRLVSEPGARRHPLIVIVPSMAVIVLIHNIYLLGQPNLVLLSLVLGMFACLRLRRSIAAGALLATAAAIKAFPILVIGYLIYRRMWTASASTVAVLAAWLLIAPLSFRTPAQAVDDLVVWSKGMIFTYNTHGIAQRPFRSYSYKNQSIMALSHRLLRDLPADGESVLSNRARTRLAGSRPSKGLPPIDPSTDLLTFLKPHAQSEKPKKAGADDQAVANPNLVGGATSEPSARWDDSLQGAEPALRAAWRVNIADLSFRAVTAITLTAMAVLSVFVAFVLPARTLRNRQTDAIEFALVTLLTVMFSPLSFNYAYVWLIYPMTVGLHLVLSDPPSAPWHRLRVAWIAGVILIPALAIPMPLRAQAYGNLFVPALLLVLGLGATLYSLGRSGASDAGERERPSMTGLAPHAISASAAAVRGA